MDTTLQDRIIALIHQEVVPATGCTEPVAVALAVANAAALIPESKSLMPEKIQVKLSANMLKNAMGVGIPGTGMIGLPIAIALGYVVADPDKELAILDGIDASQLAFAKSIVEQKQLIGIDLKQGNVDKLYIEVCITSAGHTARAVIEKVHTSVVSLELDGQSLHLKGPSAEIVCAEETTKGRDDLALDFNMVYDFAMQTPIDRLTFIEEAARLNKNASDYSLQGHYGHAVGRMIQGPLGQKYLGNSHLTHMLTYTSSACDARMDGAPVPVMSNSGSGNQGLTATLPVLTFATDEGADREHTIRALVLSNLMVIYIKQKLGRLSALCGCVVAATGSSCGITYLMGGTREQIAFAIKNMVGNITGMLCDGAKPSCSMKVSSGVSSAMLSALLAMEERVVTSGEGIVDEDVDRTVDNLTNIGREAMQETDKLVLEIMTSKHK